MSNVYYNDFTKRVFIGYLKTYNPRLAEIQKLCKQFVSENDDVLEIGCGIGFIAKNLKCKSYFGLDQSEEAVRLARLYTNKAAFVTAEFSKFITRRKFDAILLFDVIEHLEDRQSVLKRLPELLTEQGRIILSWPSPESVRQSQTRQIIDNEITVQEVLKLVGLEPIYLRYLGAESANQYIHLVFSKSPPKLEVCKQNRIEQAVKSWILRVKNFKILLTLQNEKV